jgi:CelD/BcsL family acetyltransferase involved in cellulose biosynthesis
MLDVTVARSVVEAAPFIDPWAALCRTSAGTTPFQSEAWVVPWMTCMRISEPRILAVRCGRDLVGVAPLFAWGEAPRRTISPLGAGISDHLDVVAAAGFEACTLDAVTEWLEREAPAWDACVFDELGPQALLRRLRPPGGRAATFEPQSVCPVLALPAEPRPLDAVIPRLQAQKVRKDRRRAEGIGPVTFERADRGDAAATLHLLFELHAKRWQLRGQPGVLADARIRDLHVDAAARFGRRGELRLYLLKVGGAPAAVVYGLRWGRRLHLYMQGIEPALDRASPGTLVLAHVLEDAMGEGITEVDFLRGGEAYKYAWGASDEVNVQVRIA